MSAYGQGECLSIWQFHSVGYVGHLMLLRDRFHGTIKYEQFSLNTLYIQDTIDKH